MILTTFEIRFKISPFNLRNFIFLILNLWNQPKAKKPHKNENF